MQVYERDSHSAVIFIFVPSSKSPVYQTNRMEGGWEFSENMLQCLSGGKLINNFMLLKQTKVKRQTQKGHRT